MRNSYEQTRQFNWTLAFGTLGFGILIWFALPAMVVVIDDDHAYLRSVVETFQHGRPWTHDWLTPWAASMSGLVALIFTVTGSFSFAVHFSLALSGALGFLGLCGFLQANGAARGRSVVVSALALSCPTVMFMLLMFTSVALYLGCLWLCVWSYQRRNWPAFFAVWLVGVASRQSAVVWVALPAFVVMRDLWLHRCWWPREKGARSAAILVGLSALAFLLIKQGMNHTHGQRVAEQALKEGLGGFFQSTALRMGFCAIVGGYGIGRLATVFANPNAISAGIPVGRRLLWCLTTVLAMTGGAAAAVWCYRHIAWTHSCYNDVYASTFFAILGAASGLGLTLGPFKPRLDFLLAGAGAWALLALYKGVFDYYYIDPFFWGFAAAITPLVLQGKHGEGVAVRNPAEAARAGEEASAQSPATQSISAIERRPYLGLVASSWPHLLVRGAAMATVLLLSCWNLRCYVRLKADQDRFAATNLLYERVLREGKLQPHEIGFTTFGYAGWLLEPYFGLHEGKGSPDLAGFLKYTEGWDGHRGLNVLTTPPASVARFKRWLPSRNPAFLRSRPELIEATLAECEMRTLWFWTAKYSLVRVPFDKPPSDRLKIDYVTYRRPIFPLNDEEWSALLRGEGGSAPRDPL